MASGQESHWLIEGLTIVHLYAARPYQIYVNFIFKHIHAASINTVIASVVPFPCENEYFVILNLHHSFTNPVSGIGLEKTYMCPLDYIRGRTLASYLYQYVHLASYLYQYVHFFQFSVSLIQTPQSTYTAYMRSDVIAHSKSRH